MVEDWGRGSRCQEKPDHGAANLQLASCRLFQSEGMAAHFLARRCDAPPPQAGRKAFKEMGAFFERQRPPARDIPSEFLGTLVGIMDLPTH